MRARPGMILGHVNAMLARYGRRVGPDPASSNACTIGGVIANNSGGMRCTVKNDAYQTVSAMTFVTPSGAIIDTSAPDAEAAFERAEPDLAQACWSSRRTARRSGTGRPGATEIYDPEHPWLPALRSARRRDAARNLSSSSRRIGGYARVCRGGRNRHRSCAQSDQRRLDTGPNHRRSGRACPGLIGLGATAVELMVAPALTAAGQAFARTPSYWKTLDPKAAALLVEFGAEDGERSRHCRTRSSRCARTPI